MFLGSEGSTEMRGTLRYSSEWHKMNEKFIFLRPTFNNVLLLLLPPPEPDQDDDDQDQEDSEEEQSYQANNGASCHVHDGSGGGCMELLHGWGGENVLSGGGVHHNEKHLLDRPSHVPNGDF